MRFKSFPQNKEGRDFVVGDIHGTYDLFVQALEEIDFDFANDRMFSVGDLIDRGTDSSFSLQTLQQPWFHAILGNHEDMYLDLFDSKGEIQPRKVQAQIRNGMGWIFDQKLSILNAIRAEFLRLPVAAEIPTDRGMVGLVHAEVPFGMDWPTFKARIKSGDVRTIKTALWGRDRINHGDEHGVVGVDRVFHGHTPQDKGVQRLGNCYYVDTGAVFHQFNQHAGLGLTVANLQTPTITLERGQNLNEPVRALPETGAGPFGNYALKPY